jgi:phosphoribosylaminoimidazole carboxylase PurE protein
MSARVLVGILIGSESDRETMSESVLVLDRFGVGSELRVLSAHRSPDAVREYARGARGRGVQVLICGAGMAAHLAGAVAASTTLPVLGVPLTGGALNGVDALLSTVQMPAGIPVGTLAIGKTGARNAAVLAVEILSLADPALATALEGLKESLARGEPLI